MDSAVTLSECCTFIKDGTHGSPVRTPTGIPVLSAAHVRDGRLHFDTDRFTSDEELAAFQKRLKPELGDVLLTIVGTIGRTAIVDRAAPFVFQRSVCVLRPRKDIVMSSYLRSVLESKAVKSQFHVEKHEVAQAGIYLEALNEIRIPLPPLSEQERVTALFNQADRMVRTHRYALELTDAFLPAVFSDLFGDPQTNPKNWDKGIIDDVLLFSQYGTSQKSNLFKRGYPILGMGNITNSGSLNLSSLASVELRADEFEKLALKPGDIIFNRTNSADLVGKTACWNLDIDAVVASYLIRLRLKPEFLPEVFSALLNTRYFKNLFRDRCKKAVGQSNISPTLLREFPLYIPPIDMQRKFAALVKRVERLRSVQQEALRQAEHLFASLIDEAFSGV